MVGSCSDHPAASRFPQPWLGIHCKVYRDGHFVFLSKYPCSFDCIGEALYEFGVPVVRLQDSRKSRRNTSDQFLTPLLDPTETPLTTRNAMKLSDYKCTSTTLHFRQRNAAVSSAGFSESSDPGSESGIVSSPGRLLKFAQDAQHSAIWKHGSSGRHLILSI